MMSPRTRQGSWQNMMHDDVVDALEHAAHYLSPKIAVKAKIPLILDLVQVYPGYWRPKMLVPGSGSHHGSK